jgi:hypothetical protein
LHIFQIAIIEQEKLFKDNFNQKKWKNICEEAGFGCKIRNHGNLEIMIYPDIRAAVGFEFWGRRWKAFSGQRTADSG